LSYKKITGKINLKTKFEIIVPTLPVCVPAIMRLDLLSAGESLDLLRKVGHKEFWICPFPAKNLSAFF
jgi:hypothetical protein